MCVISITSVRGVFGMLIVRIFRFIHSVCLALEPFMTLFRGTRTLYVFVL